MELKSITIDNEGIITIHTDKGIKTIQVDNPFYQAYRTQLETISFQAYTFDDKKTKYYSAPTITDSREDFNEEDRPKSFKTPFGLDNRELTQKDLSWNTRYFNEEWNSKE